MLDCGDTLKPFPDFGRTLPTGWCRAQLDDVVDRASGHTPDQGKPEYWNGGVSWVSLADSAKLDQGYIVETDKQISHLGIRHSSAVLLPPETVILSRDAGVGKSAVLKREMAVSQHFIAWSCSTKKALDPWFLYAWMQMQKPFFERMAVGSTIKTIGLPIFKRMTIDFPPLPEQRKIAEILRTWDEALEKLTALRAAKVRRISSLRQRLFETEYASHSRLQRAKDLFETVSERARPDLPLLAVMQDIGIVRRDELDRRVAMPDGDTSTYKVVRPGDFVISLRSFEGGLEYSSIIGLVSPAYTVLRPTTDLIGDYYRHFFKSRSFIGRLDKLIFGIRDGKQIAFRDFGDVYIPAPPIADQEAHTRALGSLEADLALEDERIAALIRQKRGLMQKLLTGEWRMTKEEENA
ncbi:restriction endonuclease subunit S [uncultured Martelella sp.]|uniref:restriction endonuclease subunit S n=1 Tax=uncultured Martelella sp. TaxID=392331 RepID=UPI0029C8EFF2|nr:restriction endonuclease subunit S [uncultured Martelella sp.]